MGQDIASSSGTFAVPGNYLHKTETKTAGCCPSLSRLICRCRIPCYFLPFRDTAEHQLRGGSIFFNNLTIKQVDDS